MIGSAIIPRPLAKLPWRLIFMIVAIAGFGLVVLYSAAGGSIRPWALKQAMIFLFFLGLAISMSWLKESTIKAATFPIFALIVVMLIGVEALGLVKKGAQRWLELGPIRLQPSEFMKPAIVLTLARFYELLPAGEIRKWRAIWPALPLYLFVGSGLTLAAAAPIAFSMMHDYQRKRVFIFMDPESDPLGAGYHISQSKIAIGSGGIWGKGFLQGSQSHLDYLPEGHTDFVFATMAEEWGLVGGVLLILAFGMVIRWGMRVSANAKSRFAQLAAAGLSMTIFFYVTINLMMVMGLAPVVGVPLPLVSFGGSAVMTIMLCLGILMALERQQRSQSRLE